MEEVIPVEKCLNCGNELQGEYCSSCGQKKVEGAISIKMVFADFMRAVFLFDSSLYKTLTGLLFRPGVLVKEYLSGKRKTYLPPFQFFLLFMTIYLIALSYFGDGLIEDLNNGVHVENSQLSRVEIIQNLLRKNLNILYFVLAPFIALFIHLLYKKIKFNFAEILIFSLYIMGASFLFSTILVLMSQIDSRLFLAKGLVIFGYFPFAIVQFTDSRSFKGVIKSLSTIVLSYLTFIIIVLFLVSVYTYLIVMG